MGVTTQTSYGRAQIAWPDYAHDGGTDLHGKIVASIGKISNNLVARWSGSQTLADGASYDFVHYLNAQQNDLTVLVYDSGSLVKGEGKLLLPVSSVDANTIRITNSSGSEKTIFVYVLAFSLEDATGKRSGVIQTTNATPANMVSLSVPTDKSCFLRGVVCGRKSGTVSNVYEISALVENSSGTLTITEVSRTQHEEADLCNAAFAASGSTVSLQVQGDTDPVWWTGFIESTLI
jgi:hypothetical protein